ncbi:MAG: type I polyketide synthase [Verrucomicrobiota bacterium]
MNVRQEDQVHPIEIAITGIGCRYPGGANTTTEFWQMLCEGKDAISEIPQDRWSIESYYHPEPGTPGRSYSKWGAFLDDIRGFDAEAFGISPREAVAIDPQHRLLLECAHEAIEESGTRFEQLRGSQCGVYVGICYSDYAHIQTRGASLRQLGQYTGTGSVLSLASNRISYVFDLRGPSFSVDTACSSSLIALHEACSSLARGEIEHALVGGVNTLITPQLFVTFCQLHMLSHVGRCQSFSAAADGFVRGEGAGVVLLKPLSRALADGDPIHAVIRATGANEDGRTNGITIPSLEAQADLLESTYGHAGIAPLDVDYVEAHGTGTPVGDPIEANAIGRVLGKGRPTGRPLLMGSVKSNIGHLEGGAGIAGLIKAALVVKNREVPPNLHFDEPSSYIDFDDLSLSVPVQKEALAPDDSTKTLLAGVNSFGFGGANAHAVVSSPPVRVTEDTTRDNRVTIHLSGDEEDATSESTRYLIPLSAHTEGALIDRADSMASFLRRLPDDVSIHSVIRTAAERRSHFGHRLFVSAPNNEQLASRLDSFAAGDPGPGVVSGRPKSGEAPRLVFVCSGQGPQWWGMGRELLESEPSFRREIEACDKIVRQLGDWSLVEEMRRDEEDSRMREPAIAQPAIFALQVGIAALLRQYGIEPAAVVGHSVGEVAAAYLAGALTLDQAVRVIWWRGHTIDDVPATGRMLAVGLSEEEAERWIDGKEGAVVVAAINGPSSVTLSGEATALESIAVELEKDEVFHRFLRVDYAFHSRDMDLAREPLLKGLSDMGPSGAPHTPLYSTVTARPIEEGDLDAKYWWRNVREPVCFAKAIESIVEGGFGGAFLELAPHPVLSSFIRDCSQSSGDREARVVATLRRGEPEVESIFQSLGQLYCAGVEPRWEAFCKKGNGQYPAPLPTYPWQKRDFWNEAAAARSSWTEGLCHQLLGRSDSSGENSWMTHLDFSVYPWLQDHTTRGRSLFPATGYIELGLAAARELHGDGEGFVLEEMNFQKALFISEDGTAPQLRTVCARSSGELRILARAGGSDDSWMLHARGVVSAEKPALSEADAESKRVDLTTILSRCPDRIEGYQIYDEFHQAGFDYGESFQGISERWLGDREAVCRVGSEWHEHEEASGYAFHPSAFDSALQLFGGTMPLSFHLARSGVFVPVRVGRLRFYRKPLGELWIHSIARHVTERSIDGEVRVYDSAGHLCIELLDVTSREAFRASETVDDWLFATRWDRAEAGCGPTGRKSTNLSGVVGEALETAAKEWQPAGTSPVEVLSHDVVNATDPDAMFGGFLEQHPGWFPEALLLRESDSDSEEFRSIWNHLLSDSRTIRRLNSLLASTVRTLADSASESGGISVLEFGDPLGGPSEEILSRCGRGLKRYGFIPTEGKEYSDSDRTLGRDPRTEIILPDPGKMDEDPVAEFAPDLVLLTELRSDSAWSEERLSSLRESLPGGTLLLGFALTCHESWLSRIGLIPVTNGVEKLEAAGLPLACAPLDDPDSGISLYAARVPHPSTDSTETTSDEAEPVRLEGRWLILSGGGVYASAIAERLAKRGGECEIVNVTALEETEDSHSLRSLLEEFAVSDECRGIIHCTALDATPPEETTAETLAEDEASQCHTTLELVQALQEQNTDDPPQLFLVTSGAQDIEARNEPISLTQAPLVGLGLVIGSEIPQLRCRLIDLPPNFGNDDLDLLLDEMTLDTTEEEVALRDGARFLPSISRFPLEKMPSDSSSPPSEGHALHLPVPSGGKFEQLCFEEREMSRPAPDEVLIEIRATALNFRDVLKVLGLYPTDNNDCFLLGDECAGIVAAVGDEVSRFAPGDEVIAVSTGGLLGTHACAKAVVTIRKPEHISFEEAVTLPNVFLAAYHSLHHVARIRANDTILIHAAAGGVGLAALQLAREAGARIFATASASKQQLVKLLGAEAVFDSRSLAFAEEVRELTRGRGVDVVLNSLAGEALRKSFSIMAPYGRFLEIGKMDIYQNEGLPMRTFAANVSFHAIDIARVMTERADLAEDMFRNLEERMNSGALHPLPFRSFPARRIGEAFRHMSQGRHTGKIVITMDKPAPRANRPPAGELALAPDRSYLITGGFSGLGLEVAKCFVDHGARHLILLGRSGARDERAKETISQLREEGATVFEARGDVADLERLRDILEEAAAEHSMPTLAGVFHAAMVLEDNVLTSLDPERFHRVMLPKVAGGWNLHALTKDLPLDFFLLCSSIAATIGNPGQGNYAAANLFLDSLASYRRSLGLPGTSVAWGVLGGFGVVHEDEKLRELYQRRGITPLEPRNILDVLRLVEARNVTRIGALRVNWGRLAAALFHYKDRIRSKLGEVANADGFDWSTLAQDPGRLREDLRTLSAEEGLQLVHDSLRTRLAVILGTSAERIDSHSPLNMLGLDSLMTIELQTQLERELEVTVSESEMAENPSLTKLAQRIYQRLAGNAG